MASGITKILLLQFYRQACQYLASGSPAHELQMTDGITIF
jgi:hypothetical protein